MFRRTSPSPSLEPPRLTRISAITEVSLTLGTLRSLTVSAVSSAAAISGSAAFFEPLMQMLPASCGPPVIRSAGCCWLGKLRCLAAAHSREAEARLRHRQGVLELGLFGGRERAGQLFLGTAARFLSPLDRDLLGVLRDVSEHRHTVRQHLQEATTHEEDLLRSSVYLLNPQRPRFEDRHQRGVAREHSELAVRAVGDDELDVALEKAALNAHHAQWVFQLAGRPLLHLFALLPRLVDRADHVERLLRQVVVLAVQDLLEAAHRLGDRNRLALTPGEPLGDVEGLREEALDLARPRHGLLVVIRQLLHAEDRDDVLQVLVALHRFLHALRGVVVVLPDDRSLDKPAGRTKGIDGGVDADLDERPLESHRRAPVGEHGLDRGGGVVVGRHLNGLDRGDGALARRGDALLQLAHLGRQRGLVSDRRRHAAEERRPLRPREQVPKDVVDEQQRVRTFRVAEILRHRQPGEANARAGAGRLVHLAEHESGLREHACVLHRVIHIVAFARALAHTCKYRTALVLVGDVADQLLDDHGLAGSGAAEQPDLRTLREGADEVDDLDPGLEDLHLGLLLRNRRRGPVDGPSRDAFRRRLIVDRGTDYVEHAAQCLHADRNGDRAPCRMHGVAAPEAVGRVHRDRADGVVADRAFDLEHHDAAVLRLDLECLEQLRLLAGRKLDIDDGADDLADVAVFGLLALGLWWVLGFGHWLDLLLPCLSSTPASLRRR